MKIMVGIDRHSNNALCGLVDETGRRLGHKQLPCDLPASAISRRPGNRSRIGPGLGIPVRAGPSAPAPAVPAGGPSWRSAPRPGPPSTAHAVAGR